MLKETANTGMDGFWGFTHRLATVGKHIGVAVLGLLMARTSLWGGIAPLGAALSAGIAKKYLSAAAFGSLLGYIIPSGEISALRYTAVLLAITAIRYIISGLKGVGKNAVWSGVTALFVVTGVNLASVGADFARYGAGGVAEGLLAAVGAYFISKASNYKLSLLNPSIEQTASLLISVNLAVVSLYSVSIDGISLGRIAMILLILFAARYGRTGIASICSITAAGMTVISDGGPQMAVVMCLSGLSTGVFASMGKAACIIAEVSVAGVWAIVSTGSREALCFLIESVAAGLIFLIIPKTVTSSLSTIIAPPTVTPDTKGLRRTLTMRLGFASAALHGVSETVEDVARCLSISKKPSFATVLQKTEDEACKGCTFHMYCWEKQRKVTVDAALGMSDAIRKCRPVDLADVPDEFTERCLRIERFEDALSKNYTDFLSDINAEKRIAEMRSIVSHQMDGIADMLEELSDEFRTAQNYDINQASRVAAALKEIDIRADECSCVVDKYGRMTVEIRLLQIPEMPINRARVLQCLQEVCERDFEPPEINRQGRTYYITATEKAVFSVDCGCTQLSHSNNRHCGDTCRYFFDGRGRLVVIVSDGMGSGGRAAVDSAMTSGLAERLIKAGFGFDCTLRLVNSAMMFKSTDESLSTLDISCVDLYTGKTELFKAGAAPTIVRRNGRTGRAECRSLPTGILHEVGFDKATVTLCEDDILLMMSDGVCTDGTDWICAEVESWQNGGASQLSERIATAARRRRHDGHDDDITVFAMVLEKAV